MEEEMNKKRFLEELRQGRKKWEALLAQVPKDRMAEPTTTGAWSVKDTIAHVLWYEREMVGMLMGRTLSNGSDLWLLPTDERNDRIFQENKDISLDKILDEAENTYRRLWKAVAELTDEDLNKPSQYEAMPADWVPWKIIADNTYWHYQHHEADVRI